MSHYDIHFHQSITIKAIQAQRLLLKHCRDLYSHFVVSITISLSSNKEPIAITAAITSKMAKFVQYSEVEMIVGCAETAGGQTQLDRTNYCPFLLSSLLSFLCYSCYIRITKVFL